MDIWSVTSNTVTGGHTHDLKGHPAHALLVPLASSIFQELSVSASLCSGNFWWPIHSEPDLIPFESAHGVEPRRWAYNERKFSEVREQKRAVRGEHAGYTDLFVPILINGKVVAIIVVGPFGTSRVTAPELLSRWHWLTGQQGHMADREFAAYARATLATLVLEDSRATSFERHVSNLAELMGGACKADAVANHAGALRLELREARSAERMWAAAREMLDERSAKVQFSAASADRLARLGLLRAADHAMVGLIASAKNADPVEEIVRADALQRAAAEFARTEGGVISGRFGDHGVTFLFAAEPSLQKKKKKMAHVAERVAVIGRRRFGIGLHFGTGPLLGAGPLSASYQVALGASEIALARGERLVFSEKLPQGAHASIRKLREELCRLAEEHPERLPAEFERYLARVAVHASHRVEAARTELEVCFERVSDRLLGSGAIETKSLEQMREYLERVAHDAPTLNELFAAYRRTLSDLAEAVRRPIPARQDRGLRRSLEYIHQHYTEDLGVKKVAALSGFAPSYFSELFKKREGTTFEKYVFKLRLERAKQLLTGTDLSVKRIAELSGYASPEYLCRVFRRVVGVTPMGYRQGLVPEWFRAGRTSAARRAKKKGAV